MGLRPPLQDNTHEENFQSVQQNNYYDAIHFAGAPSHFLGWNQNMAGGDEVLIEQTAVPVSATGGRQSFGGVRVAGSGSTPA